MKKTLVGVLSTAIVLSMCVTAAFAASPRLGRYFVDADGDGICDVCGVAHAQPGGGNFVDADGDGVCDNYQSGQGRGFGCGGQCGRGSGFWGGRGR